MYVLHNQRGMSSLPFAPMPGRYHLSLTWKSPLLLAFIPPKAALLLGPQGLLAVCDMTMRNRPGFTRETFLHCIVEVTEGDVHCAH